MRQQQEASQLLLAWTRGRTEDGVCTSGGCMDPGHLHEAIGAAVSAAAAGAPEVLRLARAVQGARTCRSQRRTRTQPCCAMCMWGAGRRPAGADSSPLPGPSPGEAGRRAAFALAANYCSISTVGKTCLQRPADRHDRLWDALAAVATGQERDVCAHILGKFHSGRSSQAG